VSRGRDSFFFSPIQQLDLGSLSHPNKGQHGHEISLPLTFSKTTFFSFSFSLKKKKKFFFKNMATHPVRDLSPSVRNARKRSRFFCSPFFITSGP
jgi:hypothetical protein